LEGFYAVNLGVFSAQFPGRFQRIDSQRVEEIQIVSIYGLLLTVRTVCTCILTGQYVDHPVLHPCILTKCQFKNDRVSGGFRAIDEGNKEGQSRLMASLQGTGIFSNEAECLERTGNKASTVIISRQIALTDDFFTTFMPINF
jgi:hypothetical protein